MPDRPADDAVDDELRAVTNAFVDAAPVAPELEELLSPIPDEWDSSRLARSRSRQRRLLAAAAVISLIAGVVGAAVLIVDRSDDRPADTTTFGEVDGEEIVSVDPVPVEGVPDALFAAEAFTVAPSAARLKDLLAVLGGLEALELGGIEGSYDIVTFDPSDTDRVLLSQRRAYHTNGMNQDENLLWEWSPDGVSSAPFRPDIVHDSASFNRDGTVTLWVVGASVESGLLPRQAVILDADGNRLHEPTEAIFHQRWAIDGGVVLALVMVDESTYGGYDQMAIFEGATVVDVPRAGTEWVEVPMPGVVMAGAGGVDQPTRVWDSATLQNLDDHPLAGRALIRAAVSADGSTALGVDLDGALVVIDMTSGAVTSTFGTVDVGTVAVPLAVSDDGSVGITTEQDGTVTMWWVPEGETIATFSSTSGPHRELSNPASTRVTSAASFDTTRVARRNAIRPDLGVTWTVLDTDVDSWISRACELAGRPLTSEERTAGGFPDGPGVCG